MSDFDAVDVVVLGGGPGGYTAAFRAADLGLSVMIVEQDDRLGGVCLNVGCIPSKTLLHAAGLIEKTRHFEGKGLSFSPPKVDLSALAAHKDDVVGKLTTGLSALAEARKVRILRGKGTLADKRTLSVETSAGPVSVPFRNLIIAVGSRPFRLPDLPDDQRIWDSTDALALKTIPKRFLIIGGGIIGLEMATVYHALGSEITVVEMKDQLIPPADADLVKPLYRKLKKEFADIFLSTQVTKVVAGKGGLSVTMKGSGAEMVKEYDALLVAVGRRSNGDSIQAEKAGLEIDKRAILSVNERMETSVPGIYAIGDVTGEPMLAHKATHQGKTAAEVIAGHKAAFTPLTIPSVAYTHPELAWMGLTEREAKEKGIAYKRAEFPWAASGRALSALASEGFTKALFDIGTGRILGAGIVGENAGELISEAVLALEMGADFRDIALTIHPHPTLAETFAFAAEIADGSITDILMVSK
ncbi:MAG: dihydrolipoyl dehydrogenase [Treponemataceae bacterium]